MKAYVLSAIMAVAACGPGIGTDTNIDAGTATTAASGMGMTSGQTTSGTSGASDGSASTDVSRWDFGSGPKLDVTVSTTGLDTTTGGCWDWASRGCWAMPQQTSTVAGTTPVGVFATGYAFFGSSMGCGGCVHANVDLIHLVADPADFGPYPDAPPVDGLAIELSEFEGPPDIPTIASLNAFRNGESAWTNATVVIDNLPAEANLAEPYAADDPFIVTGSITVEKNGWSVHGNFQAGYCPDKNEWFICE